MITMMMMIKQQQGVIYSIVAITALISLPVVVSAPAADTNNNNRATRIPVGAGQLNSSSSSGLHHLNGRCREMASCEARKLHRGGPPASNSDRSSCYCDKKCQMYDDCCPDSDYADPLSKRIELGAHKVHERHNLWHCKRINNIFGDIVLRASCQPEWFGQQPDPVFAQLIRRRCEYAQRRAGRGGPKRAQASANNMTALQEEAETNEAAQRDPIGMMMPITDLGSGVTYANSYCLRCNTLIGVDEVSFKRRKVLYWSPLLECNYITDSDERNQLFDLISSKKGKALHYSNKKHRWMIHVDHNSNHSSSGAPKNANETSAEQRTCSIMPTIPDSVEHLVRHCRAGTIRSCPALNPATANMSDGLMRARVECQFGHQALTYSRTRRLVYYNQACAICNREPSFSCEPSSKANAAPGRPSKPAGSSGQANDSDRLYAPGAELTETTTSVATNNDSISRPPTETDEPEEEEEADEELETNSAARANSHESAASGSFSVLMDLYGSSADEASSEQLLANMTDTEINAPSAASHHPQCPSNQVFDPFYLTCRCVVCGLNNKFVEGRCVRKFKPAMVYLTQICLIVSITSLALYLVLYALSTFDLRPVAKQLAQWEFEAETATAAAAAERESRESDRKAAAADHHSGNSNSSAGAANNGRHMSSLYRRRGSYEGNSASSGPTPPNNKSGPGDRHSQSLSTRGVASLAGALLAAYLLFMAGHGTETGYAAQRQTICSGLAVATYYCFMVAFAWMFLLAYDIWRTLRLATCRLRAPAQHSQSTRYLSYALSALLLSALLVGFALLVDQFPASATPKCDRQTNQNDLERVLCAGNWWAHFIQVYKPKFGHQAGACWFSNRRALGLFFGLPVTLIMLANLLFFLHSSCMVIRTSSRSSRQLSSQKTSTVSQPRFESIQKALSSSSDGLGGGGGKTADFAFQNSLTTSSIVSVSTLQSHLSASSTESSHCGPGIDQECLSPPPDGAKEPSLPLPQRPQQTLGGAGGAKQAKLGPSLSSNSLKSTNNSTYSIASSLANCYDSHLQSIQSMMGSILKDYRLYCRLSTILGLTWLTGLLASLVDQSETLWYLFVILNTLQGLFIFIAFGCKRSKLSNLELLFNYLKFWLLHRCFTLKDRLRNPYKRKGSVSSDESAS